MTQSLANLPTYQRQFSRPMRFAPIHKLTLPLEGMMSMHRQLLLEEDQAVDVGPVRRQRQEDAEKLLNRLAKEAVFLVSINPGLLCW